MNGNFKSNIFKKSASTSNLVVENKKDVGSSEKKLGVDSGYDCNYCNVKKPFGKGQHCKNPKF